MIFPYDDIGLLQNLMGQIVDVSFVVDDFLDAGIYEDLGAHGARESSGVDRRSFHADSEIRRLRDGILFSVDTSAQLMPGSRWDIHLNPDATELLAMTGPLRRSVVSCGQNPLVLDDDGTDLPSQTCGPRGYQARHLHEVLVIAGSIHETESLREDI